MAAKKVIDMTGQKIGRLTVIERMPKAHKNAYWKCRCDCGNETTVRGTLLRYGSVKSCGCLQKEAAARNGKSTKTHGLAGTEIYKKWVRMLMRCSNKKLDRYNVYGGRGIKVCERWLKFKNFYEDMKDSWKPGLSLDRIDVNGNYCKENCRWIPLSRQKYNLQKSLKVNINGELLCLAEAIAKYGKVQYRTAWRRIKDFNWPPEKAILTEVIKR